MLGKFAKVATVVAGVSTVLFGAEKKFDMYGFMDVTLSKYMLHDKSPFYSWGYDEDLHVNLSHVNTYFDLKPNSKTRSLIELGFQGDPIQNSTVSSSRNIYISAPDVSVTTGIGPILVPGFKTLIASENGSTEKSNTVTKPLDGLVYEWGSFSLERAWMELQLSQYANIRAGKFITPAGVWNVDHGSPVILTVKQPYQTSIVSIFPKSQYGLMERGRVFLGDADLDYKVYLSSGRLFNPDNSVNKISFADAKDVAVGGNLSFALPVSNGLKLGFSAFTGMLRNESSVRNVDVDVSSIVESAAQDAAAQVLAGNLSPDQASIGGYIQQQIAANAPLFVASEGLKLNNHEYETIVANEARENIIGFDAQYKVKQLALQSEFNYQKINNQMAKDKETKTRGFYGLISYKFNVHKNASLTPYFMYENVYQEGADNNAGSFLSGYNTGTPNSVIDGFQTFVGGLNCRLYNNYLVKMEYTYGTVSTIGLYEPFSDYFNSSAISLQLSMAF